MKLNSLPSCFRRGCQENLSGPFARPTAWYPELLPRFRKLVCDQSQPLCTRAVRRSGLGRQGRNGYCVDQKNTHRVLPIHRSVLLLTPALALVPDALSTAAPTNSNVVTEATQRSPLSLLLTAAHKILWKSGGVVGCRMLRTIL